MTLRAAIYARVSSQAQRDRQTIEGQLQVLRAYVKAQGWKLAGEYIDDGKTAKAGHLEARDGYARLVKAAEARAFDLVAVVDVDRLTRTDDMIERAKILGPLQQAGIDIVTPSGGRLDLRTFLGELYATIQALGAADWLRKHKERIKAGKDVAIAKGKKPAGPTPYGLRYDRWTGIWTIDEDEAAIVREIYRRVAGGEACEAIAADLTRRAVPRPRSPIWRSERVWQIATHATYRGEWTADKARGLVVPVPAIVEAPLWYAVQDALMRHGKRGLRRTKHVYLLEGGLAKCGVCDGAIWIASAIRNGPARFRAPSRYVCRNRKRPERGAARCTLPHLRTQEIDDRLWSALQEAIRGDLIDRAAQKRRAGAGENAERWRDDLAAAEKRLGRLTATETALLARFRHGAIGEVAMDVELGAIARERALLGHQVAAAQRAQFVAGRRENSADQLEKLLADLRRRIPRASAERRRQLAEILFGPGAVTLGPWRIEAWARLRSPSLVGQRSTSELAEPLLEFQLVA